MKLCITPSFIGLIAVMLVIVVLISVALIWYGKYSAQSIKEGKDDRDLTFALKKQFGKSKIKCETYTEFLKIKSKKKKVKSILSSVFYIAVTLLAIAVALLAVYTRTKGGQFFIGDRAYVTIVTGSMSQRNPDNPYYSYLATHSEVENDMGSIPVDSFVEIERGDGHYELYDIVAFEHRGVTYLHRIISVNDDGTYTTMGDSNNASLAFEKNMPSSRIIGIFTGRQSIVIGKTMTFIRSNVGIVTVVAVLTFLFMASIANSYISDASAARTKVIAEDIDRKNEILKRTKH